MRCGIVGMGTRSVGANSGKTPTIAHVPMEIVHRVPPANGDYEKVPKRGLSVRGLTTDGSSLYPKVFKELWPDVPHQLCEFHILKEITKRSPRRCCMPWRNSASR